MGTVLGTSILRLIHTLGGCGGTLLSRCIAVLPGVALLSEVNPASVKLFPKLDPLYQDRNWLHLLAPEDVEHFSRLDLRDVDCFRALIQAFHDRACASGRHLVIRDYNYIDFIGSPFKADTPRRLSIYGALPQSVPTACVALVRHPVDQWLSLRKHKVLGSGAGPAEFCDAYAIFLRELRAAAVFKYEDFVANPDRELQAICRELSLPFAPSFLGDFSTYDSVTGDVTRLRDQSISAPPRKTAPSGVWEAFRSSASFGFVLGETGYAATD